LEKDWAVESLMDLPRGWEVALSMEFLKARVVLGEKS